MAQRWRSRARRGATRTWTTTTLRHGAGPPSATTRTRTSASTSSRGRGGARPPRIRQPALAVVRRGVRRGRRGGARRGGPQEEAEEEAAQGEEAAAEGGADRRREGGGWWQPGGTNWDSRIGGESVLTEDGVGVPVSDNIVLRKLIRGPRYFDPGETMLEASFNCGEEGHVAANCPMEKRKKPCFVCGLFGHNAKQCTQGQDRFICKKGGHKAKDCPGKHKRNTQQSTILCLRCGETGHDMFGCANGYPLDDLKEIKCYMCKQNGHLCCADFSDNYPKEVTCYNCAQSGYIGLRCAKQRMENSAITAPTLCFNCGEEGHIAKGCTKNAKSDRLKGEWSAHSRKKDKGENDFGTRSTPRDARKTSTRKRPPFLGEKGPISW